MGLDKITINCSECSVIVELHTTHRYGTLGPHIGYVGKLVIVHSNCVTDFYAVYLFWSQFCHLL